MFLLDQHWSLPHITLCIIASLSCSFGASKQRGEFILFLMVCFFFFFPLFNSARSFWLNVYPKWYCYKVFSQFAQIFTLINNFNSVSSVMSDVLAATSVVLFHSLLWSVLFKDWVIPFQILVLKYLCCSLISSKAFL